VSGALSLWLRLASLPLTTFASPFTLRVCGFCRQPCWRSAAFVVCEGLSLAGQAPTGGMQAYRLQGKFTQGDSKAYRLRASFTVMYFLIGFKLKHFI
jgi:hypothetical protein